MKIYFTASNTGKENYLKNYQKIIKTLKKLGHQVLSEHALGNPQKNPNCQKAKQKFHQKLKSFISDCDLFIAEVSSPSIAVAYEISLSLKKNKPTLILYSERNTEQDLPGILGEKESDKVMISQYKLGELAGFLEQAIEYLKQKMDQRFTFFITPKIARWLDKIANLEKIPRAVYIRRLIEEDMKKEA